MNKYTRTLFTIVETILIFLITISIVYGLLYIIPGRIGSVANSKTDAATVAAAQAKAGYTGHFMKDYGNFLLKTITFDFGTSSAIHPGLKINSFLWRKMGISFTVSGIAVALSVLLSIPLAIWFSRRPGKIVDGIGTFFVSIALAIPGFIVGVLLVVFGAAIGLPVAFEINDFSTWIMPIISLTLAPLASKIVFLRSGIIESRSEQFVQFARVKGATRRRVEYGHILKISLFPIITYLPTSFLGAFIGSMLVENIFGIPGAGNLLAQGIQSKDFTVVQSILTVSILLIAVSFMLRDIMYRAIDPRVK